MPSHFELLAKVHLYDMVKSRCNKMRHLNSTLSKNTCSILDASHPQRGDEGDADDEDDDDDDDALLAYAQLFH